MSSIYTIWTPDDKPEEIRNISKGSNDSEKETQLNRDHMGIRKYVSGHLYPTQFYGSPVDVYEWLTVEGNIYQYTIFRWDGVEYISAERFMRLFQSGKRKASSFFGMNFDKPESESSSKTMNENSDNTYQSIYKDFDVIDLTEQMNFNRGSAVKYIAQAGTENEINEIKDLEKARWYIDREIQRLGGKSELVSSTWIPCDSKYHSSPEASHICKCRYVMDPSTKSHSQKHKCYLCVKTWGYGEESTPDQTKYLVLTEKLEKPNRESFHLVDSHGVRQAHFDSFAMFDLTALKSEKDAEKMLNWMKETIHKVTGFLAEKEKDCGCRNQFNVGGIMHACDLNSGHYPFEKDSPCTCRCGAKRDDVI